MDSSRETGRDSYFGLLLPMKKSQNRKEGKQGLLYAASYLWEQVRRKQPKILGKTQSNGREKIKIAQGNTGETSTLARREWSLVYRGVNTRLT